MTQQEFTRLRKGDRICVQPALEAASNIGEWIVVRLTKDGVAHLKHADTARKGKAVTPRNWRRV